MDIACRLPGNDSACSFRKVLGLLFMYALMSGSMLLAQSDSARYETETIHVVKARMAPYFTVTYKYKVANNTVKDPSKLRALFVKSNADTLNRRKLRLINPEKLSLSQDLSERITYTFTKKDTPYVDTLRIYFRLNKQGKITAIDMDELGVLNDSLKINSWYPSRPHDVMAFTLYKIMGAFPDKTIPGGHDNRDLNVGPNAAPYVWTPGGYARRSRRKQASLDSSAVAVFRQSFACEAIVIVSTRPQVPIQKETGIRFVPNERADKFIRPPKAEEVNAQELR
jgi:hypothetical protein